MNVYNVSDTDKTNDKHFLCDANKTSCAGKLMSSVADDNAHNIINDNQGEKNSDITVVAAKKPAEKPYRSGYEEIDCVFCQLRSFLPRSVLAFAAAVDVNEILFAVIDTVVKVRELSL